MYRTRPFRRERRIQQRRVRPGLAGCLLWILLLIAILIVASLLFGGFRKGTRTGLGPAPARVGTAAVTAGGDRGGYPAA
ncbi:MAG TPA: hypothetical protein VKV33_07555 [Streptosporangiaceae bacterium]|jgi:hypothetical protein|nr:hypothetical protein [Streptosporangiaceae bacterium]